MNRYRIMISAILLALLLTLSGCLSLQGGKETEITNNYIDTDPVTLYEQATEQLRSADVISLYIITEKNTTLPNQIYHQVSHQRLTIENPGSDTMRSSLTERLSVGSHDITLHEVYKNGTGYITIDGGSFCAPITADDYAARFAPAVCFDLSLYKNLEVCGFGAKTGVFLNQATAAESWALPQGATFSRASGYALLNESGLLTHSQYTISYTQDSASITESTKIIICPTPSESRTNFDTPAEYTPIDNFDIPRLLEQSCGYLLQTQEISSTASTTMNCQTFAIERAQSTKLAKRNTGSQLSANIEIVIDQVHQSRGGETVQFRQVETFEDGIYTISQDDAKPVTKDIIDYASMGAYCEDLLVQDILLPEHIDGATITESDQELTITFTPKQAFAEAICSKISSTLYNDPQILHDLSSSLETEVLQFVLNLDKETMLPTSFLSEYRAYHIIEQIPYLLEGKTEQTYQYE